MKTLEQKRRRSAEVTGWGKNECMKLMCDALWVRVMLVWGKIWGRTLTWFTDNHLTIEWTYPCCSQKCWGSFYLLCDQDETNLGSTSQETHTYKIRVRKQPLLLLTFVLNDRWIKRTETSRSAWRLLPYLFHSTSGNVGDVVQRANLGLSSELHLLIFDLHISTTWQEKFKGE